MNLQKPEEKVRCTSTLFVWFGLVWFYFVWFVLKEQMRGDVCLQSGIGVSKNGFYISKWLKGKSKEV